MEQGEPEMKQQWCSYAGSDDDDDDEQVYRVGGDARWISTQTRL